MNGYVITGILIIAVGTLIMAYGTNHANNVQSAQTTGTIKNQLEQLGEKVDRLQLSDNVSVEEKAEVLSEFQRLASEFEKQLPELKLEYQKRRLSLQENELLAGKEFASIIGPFLQDFRSALNAYGSRPNTPITYDIPDLPGDLTPVAATEYHGVVSFSNNHEWTLRVHRAGRDLTLIISIRPDEGPWDNENCLQLVPDIEGKKMSIYRRGVFDVHLDNVATDLSLDDFCSKSNDIVRNLIEFELVRIGNP